MSEYLDKVLQASGGHAAPVENLKEQDIRASLEAAGMLVPEEQDLADALLKIVEKYGKFNDDNSGVWAGYDSAEKNVENAKIGVKCGNCVFYNAPNGCSIIAAAVEEGGLCRFAVLPDGAVTAAAELEKSEDDPCWDGYVQVGMKKKNGNKVPNCVPSSATINYLIDDINSSFGVSRHVSKEAAYEVARKACDKYSYLSSCEDIHSAIMWELHTFAEYATTGLVADGEDFSMYADLLSEGHPDTDSSLVASLVWVSGAPELDNSGRQVLINAFSNESDYVDSLHSSTRLKVLISSGSLSEATTNQLKTAVQRYQQVD
jgi:hypothetical protein